MKNIIKIGILTLAGAASLCSCTDWFDVSPKTDLKAEEFFAKEEGFMSALAATYRLMASENTYAGELSFHLMEQLVNSYDRLPDGANSAAEVYIYTENTKTFETKTRLADVWLNSYEVIANANNLLKWLDSKGEEVIFDKTTRDMIRGEALAIRAYVHFDLLRGWGPIYSTKSDSLSIPYRKVADNSKQPLLPAKKIVEHVLEDLTQAGQLLGYEKGTSLSGSLRRYRFNYHAVNATMARVYCYIGDETNAVRYAKEVIAGCGLDLQVSNQGDPMLFDEVLCGMSLEKMTSELSTKFSEGPKFVEHLYCTISTLNGFFGITGTETEDIRAKSSAFLRYNDQDKAISLKYIKNDAEIIPLIRLPEMYYILCEMSPLSEAPAYLNKVRNRRGYSSSSNVQFSSHEQRVQALSIEYRKEFYAEGQYFYFLKKNQIRTFQNCPVSAMTEKHYVFPLPDNEKEYGWTSPDEEQ